MYIGAQPQKTSQADKHTCTMFDFFKKNTFSIIYIFFLGIMPLMASSSITYWVIFHEKEIQAWALFSWVLVFLFACLSMAFALTPTTFVALLSGYFLGWQAILPVAITYGLASIIGFKVAEKIDGGRFMALWQHKPSVQQLIANLQKQEFKIIIFARLSPVLPFAVSNVLLSCAKVRLQNFVVAGFIGMLPRTLLSIWLGTQAQAIKTLIQHPSQGNSTQFAFILLVVVSVYGLFSLVKKALQAPQ